MEINSTIKLEDLERKNEIVSKGRKGGNKLISSKEILSSAVI